jgi:general secretion pathway protein H
LAFRKLKKPAKQAGFTLIEILVVVFIIGVTLGFATLSLSGRAVDDKAEEEAQRMLQIFRLARDEAGMTGLELGWLATHDGYRFLALAEQGWAPYGDRSPLHSRTLEKPLQLTVKVEDLPIKADPKRDSPQILFLSSGEVTPFSVDIGAPGLEVVYSVSGNLLGQLELKRVSADE